jgi:glycosyltransferase involved in cell wall biosynthesis
MDMGMEEGGGLPALSVVIATRNRRDELGRALASVLAQTVDCEIIVLDDASGDGTADMVRADFPQVRLFRSDRREGYIRQRNRGAAAARAPVITTFDDDAELISPRTFEVGLAAFDHPRVAVVALPTVDLGREYVIRNRAPDDAGRYVSDTFPGAASLLRRDLYLALGGYRDELVHRGEESEYSRRLYSRGFVVRICLAPEVHHHLSRHRDLSGDVRGQARAQMLQTMWAMRYRDFPRRAVLSLGHGARNRSLLPAMQGLAAGAVDSVRLRRHRDPLPQDLLTLLRRLERERVTQRYRVTLEDVENRLPPLAPSAAERWSRAELSRPTR